MSIPNSAADSHAVNQAMWDDRAPAHAASDDYEVQRFVDDPAFLSRVVQFDLPLLGDVRGLKGVHLQCHIGTDTVSLTRLGATMTGLDFSAPAIAAARSLAERAQAPTQFVRADVYDASTTLIPASYDLVFTGVGALCWLPDIDRWADVVEALLAPGGRLFIREGHPMLWALDEAAAEPLTLSYPYFERPDPDVFDEPGTYVTTEATFTHNVSHTWNHGIGEIVSALLTRGMHLTGLVEHQSVPWEAFPGHMVRDDLGEWSLADRPWRLAASYTLQAVKPVSPVTTH